MLQSTKISKADAELLLEKENKIIKELRDGESKEYGWKKQKILELREIYNLKLQYGLLPIKEKKNLCTYMWNNVIEKHGITYSRGNFPALFSDDEKQTEKSPTGTNFDVLNQEHSWDKKKTVDGLEIQNCKDCDCKLINGVIYEPEKETEEKEDKDEPKQPTLEIPDIMRYEITKILEKFKAVCKLLIENADELQDKYLLSLSECGDKTQRKEIKDVFESYFTKSKLKELEDFVDNELVNQKHNKNLLDWRLRIGRYEKLIAKTMMLGDKFIHEVAKKLHCSAKHMKNDVLKENVERDLKKFKECPACGKDIADIINRQLIGKDYEEDGFINNDGITLKARVEK